MFLRLSNMTFYFINVPLVVFNIIANIFFAFCIIGPRGACLKQPVKILLGSLVCCSTFYLVSLVGIASVFYTNSYELYIVTFLFALYTVETSLSTSVWLHFFYFTQIVPFKRALFLWVKRNIKSIIYGALVFDRMFFLFDVTVRFVNMMDFYSGSPREFNRNLTHINGTTYKNGTRYNKFFYVNVVTLSLAMIYTFLNLCVMSGSSFTTVCYLTRHIRSMSVSSSSPRLDSQMRVATTGLLQGVLYFCCSVWIFLSSIFFNFTDVDFDNKIFYTVISLYRYQYQSWCWSDSLPTDGSGYLAQSHTSNEATEDVWVKTT